MHYFLFPVYLLFFSWLVTRVKFFTRSGLSPSQLVVLFLFKILVGILYAWIGIYYKEMGSGSDTWMYHYEALREYHLLLTHPGDFFTNLFHNPYGKGGMDFFSVNNSWWNDLKSNAFLKFLAILNIFSFGQYYLNLVLYSFIGLFGAVGIFRVLKDAFPKRKIEVLLSTFLLPSFIYWTSGIHKEGLIFLCISLIIFHLYFGFRNNDFQFYRWLVITISFFFILLLRNFLVVPLLPALFAWAISRKFSRKPLWTFAAVYLLFILFFFTAKYIHPSLDLPAVTLDRQESFIALGGRSDFSVEKIDPSLMGFIRLLPQALFLSTLRPTFWDVHHLLSLAACVEVYFYLLLLILFLFLRVKNSLPEPSFMLFCLFFSFSLLLMIGYSVNNLGTIVRYRSIVLPLLIIPMVARIDWRRISKVLLNA